MSAIRSDNFGRRFLATLEEFPIADGAGVTASSSSRISVPDPATMFMIGLVVVLQFLTPCKQGDLCQ
jgi:hypothetical protein